MGFSFSNLHFVAVSLSVFILCVSPSQAYENATTKCNYTDVLQNQLVVYNKSATRNSKVMVKSESARWVDSLTWNIFMTIISYTYAHYCRCSYDNMKGYKAAPHCEIYSAISVDHNTEKYTPPGKKTKTEQRLKVRQSSTTIEDKRSNVIRKWAVLVAGSSGWGNYRHQADICRAYQILRAGGLKKEHIIVFMYDDIANHTENRYKGEVFNIGISGETANVYAGVPKDYTGNAVTWNNLMMVLLGVKSWPSAKVLTTGPKDHVFIYFSGHGDTNYLEMPTINIHRNAFLVVLQSMQEIKPHNKLVVYVQACKSESMFEGESWLDHSNIFITTSTNSTHPCHACFWNTTLNAYLSNLYGAIWMNDTESTLIHRRSRTIYEQYSLVRDKLAMEGNRSSTVMRFGSMTIATQDIGEFFRDEHRPIEANS